MKKLLAILIAIAAVATVGAVQLNAQARDCDSNSVIYCGAGDAAEFTQKYNENATGDLPGLYAHYGINPSAIGSAQDGVATKDGRVIVGDKVVATDGRSVGRHNMPGSTSFTVGNTTFYERSNSTSFAANSINAFVFFDDNGQFIGAILKSCGNAVKATPVPVPPKPVAACNGLTAEKIDRTRTRFTTHYTAANGAVANSWLFEWGDGTSTDWGGPVGDHVYTPGTYTARVTVKTNIGNFTSPACTVSVTIAAAPAAACVSLTATQIGLTTRFTTDYTAVSGAHATSWLFEWGDGTSVDWGGPVGDHVYTPGTYTARVTVKTDIGNFTSPACTVSVTIVPPPASECKSLIATISDRTHYTLTAVANVSGGAKVTGYQFVIKDSTGKVVSSVDSTKAIVEGDLLIAGDYTAQVTAKTSIGDKTSDSCKAPITIGVEMCTVPGKEMFPKNSPQCYENCIVPGKENLPKDSPLCVVTPPELPHTGAGDGLGALVGLSSIVASIGYYVASRRNLLAAMLNM